MSSRLAYVQFFVAQADAEDGEVAQGSPRFEAPQRQAADRAGPGDRRSGRGSSARPAVGSVVENLVGESSALRVAHAYLIQVGIRETPLQEDWTPNSFWYGVSISPPA